MISVSVAVKDKTDQLNMGTRQPLEKSSQEGKMSNNTINNEEKPREITPDEIYNSRVRKNTFNNIVALLKIVVFFLSVGVPLWFWMFGVFPIQSIPFWVYFFLYHSLITFFIQKYYTGYYLKTEGILYPELRTDISLYSYRKIDSTSYPYYRTLYPDKTDFTNALCLTSVSIVLWGMAYLIGHRSRLLDSGTDQNILLLGEVMLGLGSILCVFFTTICLEKQ